MSSIKAFDAPHPAAVWAESISFDPLQIDCVTTLMLLVLDHQCKMELEEQMALMAVYSVVKLRDGLYLGAPVHQAIGRAQALNDRQMIDEIHQLRLHAERIIPRQVMSHFKQFFHESLYGV